jgi:HK97 family phage portal protein
MSLPPMVIATAGLPALKDMSAQWKAFMGIEDPEARYHYEALADFARAPADEAWVYRCVALRYQFAQSVPLKVYVRQGKNRVAVEDFEPRDAAGEDLQFLLDDANPVSMSGSDLKAYTEAALSVWGGTYWHKVRGRLGGPPQELYWLRTPDVDAQMGRVAPDTYKYGPAGASAESYDRRDIVPFIKPNLVNQFKPLSPLSSIRHEIGFSVMAGIRAEALIANWSVPPGAWVAPPNSDIGDQDRRLITRILRRIRGPKNAGRIPVLPGGLDWKQMALSPHDSELLANRKLSRLTVCAALQVPLPLAGDNEMSGVYRSTLDAERVFARGMITDLDWQADQINSWLTPDFDPSRRRLLVGFDYGEIEALQEPESARKRIALDEVKLKARTPNEYRATFKTGPAVPWGDQPLLIANVVPEPGESAPSRQPGLIEDEPELLLSALRSITDLYRRPQVRAFLDGEPLDLEGLVGVKADDEATSIVELGLRRRYNPEQIIAGVPDEHFPGLRGA